MRTQSEAGIKEVTVWEDTFVAKLDPARVWDHIKNLYIIGAIPAKEKAKLKRELMALFDEELKTSGQLALDFPMRKIIAVK